MDSEDLKYPIGQASLPENIIQKDIENWIATIKNFPKKLRDCTESLSDEQLDTPYRKDGWTLRQVVHHCYDSHHNSYTRFKWTLTEDSPVIKTYFEASWAELFDTKRAPIYLSLDAISTLHAKWVYLLKGLSDEDLDRYFIHPENNEKVTLKQNIGIYAWHCNHHFAHIENLLKSKGWE